MQNLQIGKIIIVLIENINFTQSIYWVIKEIKIADLGLSRQLYYSNSSPIGGRIIAYADPEYINDTSTTYKRKKVSGYICVYSNTKKGDPNKRSTIEEICDSFENICLDNI